MISLKKETWGGRALGLEMLGLLGIYWRNVLGEGEEILGEEILNNLSVCFGYFGLSHLMIPDPGPLV